jgi:acetyltransferase-like isoleucine patch superfamily enzyme
MIREFREGVRRLVRGRDERSTPTSPLCTYGSHTYGQIDIRAWPTAGDQFPLITVGSYSSIASGVLAIINGDHNYRNISTFPFAERWGMPELTRSLPQSTGRIEIGNDVWIGQGVLLLGNITIGSGSVIGAGAVVASSVRPYSIVVGNPAREIRRRFGDDEVERLLALRWWDLSDDSVRRFAHLLCEEAGVDGLERIVSAERLRGTT